MWNPSAILALIAQGLSYRSSSDGEFCCSLLNDKLSSTIYPSSPSYNASNIYFANQAILHPTCIHSPSSASDLSRAIKLLSSRSCQFAIRGGGHYVPAGYANINNGVLISLSLFKEVTVHPDYARIGAGNYWGDVYKVLESQNVMVAGAAVSTVGVPGFLLGGGMTLRSGEYGFGCDGVRGFQIVLGSGEILYVARGDKKHQELFRALKGGGSSFGVVAAFDMDITPSVPVYGGTYIYPESSIPRLLKLMAEYTVDPDPKSNVIAVFSYATATDTILPAFISFYDGHVDTTSPPASVAPFLSSGLGMLINTAVMRNTSQVSEEVGTSTDYGFRQLVTSIMIDADDHTLSDLYDIYSQEFVALKGIVKSVNLGCRSIPHSAIVMGKKMGGNSLGLEAKGNLQHIFWLATWESPSQDAFIEDVVINRMVKRSSDLTRSRGLLNRFQYMNYAWTDQSPIESYGLESVRRLRKVKKEYDTDGVFTYLVKGGWKIPDR
ncbi:FAD-binding domain-containing protein [Choiromyces venosus 120613-1]|uniref:FAD-binding domain-containing protein n=1 Tax=Choiromyces venosus 120613-1 TaxID=1336337 RepID=A0A3N4J5X1_9PEZI|nr:FAD-binding domain-containing protein [Choiromyces venosus 120613-1]